MEKLRELYQLADDEVKVYCFEMNAAESCALKSTDGTCYIAIDPMKLTNLADEKHKLAHELGHCETGSFYTRRCPLQTRGRCEWRAEKWAILRLLPKDMLQSYYRAGYTEPREIAEQSTLPEGFVRTVMEYYHEQELAQLSEGM